MLHLKKENRTNGTFLDYCEIGIMQNEKICLQMTSEQNVQYALTKTTVNPDYIDSHQDTCLHCELGLNEKGTKFIVIKSTDIDRVDIFTYKCVNIIRTSDFFFQPSDCNLTTRPRHNHSLLLVYKLIKSNSKQFSKLQIYHQKLPATITRWHRAEINIHTNFFSQNI